MKKLLLFGAAGFLFYKFFYNKTKLNFNIIGLKWNPARIVMQIYNPTQTAVNLQNILADVNYNGSRLAIINEFTPVIIPGNGSVSVNLNIAGDPVGFTNVIYQAINSGIDSIVINLMGSTMLDGLSVPFSMDYKVM